MKYGTGVYFSQKYGTGFSFQKITSPLSQPLPLPQLQLLHQLPLQQLLLLLLNLLPLPLPPENKSVWIKSRCRCEVEATDRSLPAVQHLPARLRLLHHRLKNHRYFDGIMFKVKWRNLFGRGVAGWMRLVDVGVVHLQVPPHLHKLHTQLGLHQISWKLRREMHCNTVWSQKQYRGKQRKCTDFICGSSADKNLIVSWCQCQQQETKDMIMSISSTTTRTMK